MDDVILGGVLVFLLILSACFSASETALTTVNKLRIRLMADEGSKKAALLCKVLDRRDKMLSAVLIGNNLVNISASSISTVLATKYFGNAGAGIATGVLTILILIFGEITPKTMASVYSEKIALNVCAPIWILMVIFTPAIVIINALSGLVLKILRIDPNKKDLAYTEGELRSIMDVSHEEGVIEEDEKVMINNVFDFGDAQAKDIMIPRIDMTFVDVDSSYGELMDIFRKKMFTRMPVFEENRDNVIGIINMKDVLLFDHKKKFSVRDFLREPYYTYESKDISDLLVEMRKESVILSIVLDEYGATSGMITMEDLLEEIVGEIRDEYDADEKKQIQKLSDEEYLVDASMKLDDINDALNTTFESEEYDSLGGLVIECLDDQLPKEGDSAKYRNWILKVVKLKRKRIVQVKLVRILTEEEAERENTENDQNENLGD